MSYILTACVAAMRTHSERKGPNGFPEGSFLVFAVGAGTLVLCTLS